MVSDKVRTVLSLAGKRVIDLAKLFGMSKQSMTNKMTHSRFSADDLIRVAVFTGCRVGFVLPDGEHIYLEESDIRDSTKKAPDE